VWWCLQLEDLAIVTGSGSAPKHCGAGHTCCQPIQWERFQKVSIGASQTVDFPDSGTPGAGGAPSSPPMIIRACGAGRTCPAHRDVDLACPPREGGQTSPSRAPGTIPAGTIGCMSGMSSALRRLRCVQGARRASNVAIGHRAGPLPTWVSARSFTADHRHLTAAGPSDHGNLPMIDNLAGDESGHVGCGATLGASDWGACRSRASAETPCGRYLGCFWVGVRQQRTFPDVSPSTRDDRPPIGRRRTSGAVSDQLVARKIH